MARSSAQRTREYRDRLRAKGLRPVQIWLRNSKAPGFAEDLRQQSLRANAADAANADLAFWETVQAELEWPPYDDPDDTPR